MKSLDVFVGGVGKSIFNLAYHLDATWMILTSNYHEQSKELKEIVGRVERSIFDVTEYLIATLILLTCDYHEKARKIRTLMDGRHNSYELRKTA